MGARNQVHMQVKNNLPAALFDIDKKPIAGFGDAMQLSHFFSGQQHFGDKRCIGFVEVIDTADMFFGHN